MKYKFFRDYDSLSKKQKVMVGVGNTVIGIAATFGINYTAGIPFTTTIVHLTAVFTVGTVAMVCYYSIQGLRKKPRGTP